MKKTVLFPMIFGLALCLAGCRSDAVETAPSRGKSADTATGKIPAIPLSHTGKNMKLTITSHNGVVHATLGDTAAARDFMAMLPLTLTLDDYNKTEKIAALPEKLSTAGVSQGYTPRMGDIAFYAPWGNLCIFYRDFRYSPSLIPLGKIDGDGILKLSETDSVTITIDIKK